MTTGLSYDGTVPGTDSFITELAALAVAPVSDINFLSILPQAITYAENRIYRDVRLMATDVPFYDSTYSGVVQTVTGNRFVSIPADEVYVIHTVAVVTPAGSSAWNSARVPLLPVSREFLDNVYGDPSVTGTPLYFAVMSQGINPATSKTSFQLMFGPAPDAGYFLDVGGTVRPKSLSSTNLTTFISLYLPEVMLMAAMIFISGYQRNWSGASSNDPQMPINYETQYRTLLTSAQVEEACKRFQAPGGTSYQPPLPAAPPARA